MTARVRRMAPRLLLLAGLTLSLGCDDEDKVVVSSANPNDPPIVVSYGPQVPQGGFHDVTGVGPYDGILFWVVAGDPDGLEDLSAVALSIQSVRLNRFIMRADTSSNSCFHFEYNDTVPTSQILATPAVLEGVAFEPLLSYPDYYGPGYYQGGHLPIPDLVLLSPNVDPWPGGCGTSQEMVRGPMVILPPVVPTPTRAAVTYMDLDYQGVKLTVYDKVGATAVATYPDIHYVYVTPEEEQALP
ncbi:MAG TPA: hypothetical protein VFR25_06275 [Candidatus Eisenbacteria bacterium]|nr:hypothetical protein [Candidatus Eisenbacteria bacterium]